MLGVSLDVTRGRVPKLDTLFWYVDRLSAMGFDQLQLYVEHTFAFAFNADISSNCSPLTADDITQLDAHCRMQGIELTPSIAAFGHMGRILSLPQFRHLAEVESDTPWSNQPWPTRMRGLTLDTRNPEAMRLVESMLDEYLPLFSSPYANIGGDETHDLGRGRNRTYVGQHGRGRLYVEHLKFLAGVCMRHGKRMMFWGDIIRNHPELLPEIPDDAILLDWGYEADSEFPALTSVARRDRDVIVCPGVSSWNRIVPGFHNAFTNITHAVTAARTHDAAGLMVTDWGDHGHFNMPTCSLPAIAYAAMSYQNPEIRLDASTISDIERSVFGKIVPGRFDAIMQLATPGDRHHTWCDLYAPIGEPHAIPWTMQLIEQHAAAARSVLDTLSDCADTENKIVADEWQIACKASILLAEKSRLLESDAPPDSSEWKSFAARVHAFSDEYAAVWRRYYRPNRLEDIRAILQNMLTSPVSSTQRPDFPSS